MAGTNLLSIGKKYVESIKNIFVAKHKERVLRRQTAVAIGYKVRKRLAKP